MLWAKRRDEAAKVYEKTCLLWNGTTYPDFPSYFEAVAGRPFDKWGEMEETYHFVSEFKPELFGAKLEEATAERTRVQAMAGPEGVPPSETEEERNRRLAEQASAAGKAGGRERDANSQGSNTTKAIQGRGAEYLVRRLKRDAPAIAADLAAGKYPSARAAGIAAGIVKVPTPLDRVAKLLPRLDATGRAEVRRMLDGMER